MILNSFLHVDRKTVADKHAPAPVCSAGAKFASAVEAFSEIAAANTSGMTEADDGNDVLDGGGAG